MVGKKLWLGVRWGAPKIFRSVGDYARGARSLLPHGFLHQPAQKENRRADAEQHELEADVSAEHAAEESRSGNDEAQQLKDPGGSRHGVVSTPPVGLTALPRSSLAGSGP